MPTRAPVPDELLPSSSTSRAPASSQTNERTLLISRSGARRRRSSLLTVSIFSIIVFLVTWRVIFQGFRRPPFHRHDVVNLPKDPLERAKALLETVPLIDGHIDLPVQTRFKFGNHVDKINLDDPKFPGHVNIPKLREGKVGGFFWSAYVPCASEAHLDEGPDFTKATWRVRDTLEQIDISKLLISKYHDTFELVTSAQGIWDAFNKGKIASLIGLEGAHQLGNSLSTLRQYYDLGVRYVTLTHTCNNAFAGSSGYQGNPIEQRGLSSFGVRLVQEMNRIGMVIDVSHTSDLTVADVLKHSRGPFIFSHSNARHVYDNVRNIPDHLLKAIAKRPDAQRPLVMATFAPQFVSTNATLSQVADHIEHIAHFVGRDHVGIGSDFDGIFTTPLGLEDVSKYPYLLAELITRGWGDEDIRGVSGGNLIRTLSNIEAVAAASKDRQPDTTLYDKRTDMKWDIKSIEQ